MKVTVFGIPNCGTVKKARVWLQENGITEEFHDFKKLGIDEEHLKRWCEQFGWEKVVNRKGLTWRGLHETIKSQIVDQESAIKLMRDNTSVIKRPVVEFADGMTLGFDENEFEQVYLK